MSMVDDDEDRMQGHIVNKKEERMMILSQV